MSADNVSTVRKVIVVDCDNTLWRGVVGEVGADGVAFGEQHRALQATLTRLASAGVLVCLASKNTPADVWSVFDTRTDFGLKHAVISGSILGWDSKVKSLQALATRFNLALDSFVFLDDNPAECAEVRGECPEVLVLEWPGEGERALQLLVMLDWLWSEVSPTDEDLRRGQMYREDEIRMVAQAEAPSLQAFLKGLEMNIGREPVTSDTVRRAAQLTQRTNQFNFTTIRRSEGELAALLFAASDTHESRVFSVRDRFGDHGIVGLVIADAKTTPGVFDVDTFLLSCRVLGRGVEHEMMSEVGRMAMDLGLCTVSLRSTVTERNEPARMFLNDLGATPYMRQWWRWDVASSHLALTANRFAEGLFSVHGTVCRAFATVLGISPEQVAEGNRFDALGCDSLKAARVTALLLSSYPKLSGTLLFELLSVSDVVNHIEGRDRDTAPSAIESTVAPTRAAHVDDIAVVGMSVRCAGANSLEAFWELLAGGMSTVTTVPVDRPAFFGKLADDRLHYAGLLKDPSLFDARYFKVSRREARTLDPQLRLFLEVACEALYDTGSPVASSDAGVFVGSIYGDYVHRANELGGLYRCWEGFSWANRLSQVLGCNGPSMAVDTACSSSATALYLACRALRAGDCSEAIVGGVNLILDPARFNQFGRMGILSPSGQCRPFSDGADGTVLGEGAGVVVLRPLAEAQRRGDRVYGVVKGVGISTGAGSVGFTVPNPQAQAEAARRALSDARTDPGTIDYVETHGTGTPVGDPIEVRGLTLAYASALERCGQLCRLGAIKPNIGHLEAASGIVGLIKTMLQLHKGTFAPTLGFIRSNPAIPFHEVPFYVQQRLEPWERGAHPRRAAVSSFGVGGSNVHAIVEETPGVLATPAIKPGRVWQHERFWI